MGLYERLTVGDDADPKVPVHQFMASLNELIRTEVTRADIITMFALRTEDEADLDVIIAAGTALPSGRRFEFASMMEQTLLLAEGGQRYTVKTDFVSRMNRFS